MNRYRKYRRKRSWTVNIYGKDGRKVAIYNRPTAAAISPSLRGLKVL